jgi:hypothetical protein
MPLIVVPPDTVTRPGSRGRPANHRDQATIAHQAGHKTAKGDLQPSRLLDHSPCLAGPARASAPRRQAPRIRPASGTGKRRRRRPARPAGQETSHDDHADVPPGAVPGSLPGKEGRTCHAERDRNDRIRAAGGAEVGCGPAARAGRGAGPDQGQGRRDQPDRSGPTGRLPQRSHPGPVRPGVAGRVRALGRVDAVLDAAGTGVLADAVALAGGPGRVITLSDPAAAGFGVTLSEPAPGRAPGALDETIALLAGGRLRLRAHTTMPMQQAAQAHRRLERDRGEHGHGGHVDAPWGIRSTSGWSRLIRRSGGSCPSRSRRSSCRPSPRPRWCWPPTMRLAVADRQAPHYPSARRGGSFAGDHGRRGGPTCTTSRPTASTAPPTSAVCGPWPARWPRPSPCRSRRWPGRDRAPGAAQRDGDDERPAGLYR